MRGLGRKLVAIQTEARCLKSNTWSTPPSRDDCSRPSSRHVAAGRKHALFSLQGAVALRARIPTWAAAPRHYQRGRQQDFVPGTRASVWIATSFRPHPRMHKHANAWWSMHLHTLLLDAPPRSITLSFSLSLPLCVCCTRARALSLPSSPQSQPPPPVPSVQKWRKRQIAPYRGAIPLYSTTRVISSSRTIPRCVVRLRA